MVWDLGLWDEAVWDDYPKPSSTPATLQQKHSQIQLGLTEHGELIWILPLKKEN